MKLAEHGGKRGKKSAMTAVARKLAVLLHRLWVSGDVYMPLRPGGQATLPAIAQFHFRCDDRSAGDRVFPVVDENCRIDEIAVFIAMPDSEFGELACPTTIRILMATNTSRGVINGAKAGLDEVVLLIDLLIPGERISGRLSDSVADVLCTVETGECRIRRLPRLLTSLRL
jgi:hypothetical protein